MILFSFLETKFVDKQTNIRSGKYFDASAVLHQLSYQANWEQFVVWVDMSP